jgi:hypothetical protein
MNKWLLLILIGCIGITQDSLAQKSKKNKWGKLTGSVESNIQFYNKEDKELGFVAPDDRFRSNNYFKLDYTYQSLTIGTQLESYEKNALLGYPENLKGTGITNYYVNYASKKINVTAGHFYEQFGSGLVLRAWEDRQLGLNNALFGGRIIVKPTGNTTLKLLSGKSRNAFTTSEGFTWGADAEQILSNNNADNFFSVGLSYVGRKEAYNGILKNFPEVVHNVAARFNYQKNKFELNGEFAFRTKDATINDVGDVLNSNRYFTGNVIQLGGSYTNNNSGVTFNLRRVDNFGQKTDRTAPLNQLLANYIPALTKQHHYSLTNIYVYNAQTRFSFIPGNLLNSAGEIGGQIEWYKNFPKNSKWGGKQGMQLNVHFSYYGGLDFGSRNIEQTNIALLKTNGINYRDFNVEVKKTWNKNIKTNITYVNLFYNQQIIEGFGSDHLTANTLVVENIFKLKKKHSLRTDVQHMWVENGKGNWAAATVEYSIAPSFNFFVADLYNYGNPVKPIHYYNAGMSFTKGSGRIMISYGRQREGLLCVGGVCRLVPASTGLSINSSFSF